MIKAFDRYVLKEIASPFAVGLLVYTFTLVIFNLFHLPYILVSKGAIALIVYLLPFLLSFTIPMSTLMGILAGLSRMSTDSEIVAFRTMGINNFRILRPVMLFSLITFLFSAWLLMYITPEANFKFAKLSNKVFRSQVLADTKARAFNQFPFYTLYFSDINNLTNEWKDVFLYSRKGRDSDTVIIAKTGKLIQNTENGESFITLTNPIVHSNKKKEPEKKEASKEQKVSEDKKEKPVELKKTKEKTFKEEKKSGFNVWEMNVELKTRAKKAKVKPLFSFITVNKNR